MKPIYSVVFSGRQYTRTLSERRGVTIANAIGLSLVVLTVLLFIFYYTWYGWSVVTAAIPAVGLLAANTILLNRFGLVNISRIWTCLLIPVIITALSVYSKTIYYNSPEELDYFTFRFVILGSCSFPWVLFSLHEKKLLLFCSLAGMAILLAYDPLHQWFDVGYSQDRLKASTYYFANVVIFISYCLLVSALAFLKWTSERHEAKNMELIDELNDTNEVLTEKNAEIEAQTSELQAQSEVLETNQKQLLDAYRMIEEQKNRLLTQNQSLTYELLEKNKDLTETNSELIKHNNELRQFSYTVSHNLRGPVASLLGLVNLVEPTALAQSDSEILDHIRTSTERLDMIIKDLTKIIDIRHDIFKIRQKISIEEEIDETFAILRKDNLQSDVTLIKNIQQHYIYSVKPMVHSILYNLLNNALKYRSPERQPVIEITASEDEMYYIISVHDNGLGIDLKRNRDNLFKLYKRFHFHTEGKGLGLYLVKLQVEALGGHIAVESEINRYTKFTVYLKKPEDIQRQVLLKERYAEIFYDAQLNATGIIWQESVTSEQYRQAFAKTLDFVKVYNTPNFIADLSRHGHIDKEDQRWMFREIIPESARNGLTRIATVHPNADGHINNYIESIQEATAPFGITQRYFTSMKEAVEWIESENEKIALKIRMDGKVN